MIRDLGTWPGGKQSWGVAINERGQVVVLSETAQTVVVLDKRFPVTRAFLWEKGRMRDLGAAFGGPGSWAAAITDRGQVAGQADLKPIAKTGHHVTHAFLWQEGKTIDLGTLGYVEKSGTESSYAVDVNEHGQIVGESCREVGTACHAFLWENGKLTDLGTLGGVHTNAVDINNRGLAVGTSKAGVPSTNRSLNHRAFLWQNGTMRDLGTLGGPRSGATAINDRGQVVGSASIITKAEKSGWLNGMFVEHAFLWQRGKMRDLRTLGGEFSRAVAINARGQVTGQAMTTAAQSHGFLWSNGRMRDLGTLGGDLSEPTAINDRGQIVGWAATRATDRNGEHVWHAFLWQNGKLTNLGTLGGKSQAAGINERGQIIGWSETTSGKVHAVLWTLKPGS
ncbi:MAG: HAF repeat-containing protein [Verrucomicrobiota bacterium]